MASLSEDPAVLQNLQAVRRDSSLLRNAYRQAKRTKNFEQAFKIAQEGQRMGLPVGVESHDEALAGVARQRTQMDYARAGIEPNKTGLDAYDFRQLKDQVPQDPQALLIRNYRNLWNAAKTQDQKDTVVENAYKKGIQLSDAGMAALERRGRAPDYGPYQDAASNQRMMYPQEQQQVQPTIQEQTPRPSAPLLSSAPTRQQSGASLIPRFRDMWMQAKTPEQKDMIVEDAYAQGVPLSEAGMAALERRKKLSEYRPYPTRLNPPKNQQFGLLSRASNPLTASLKR